MAARTFFSWLIGANKSPTTNRRRSTVRLALEALEDRLVPATLVVNSLADMAVNLSDATVTLRDAIYAAENDVAVAPGGTAGGGADVISFDPALFAGGPQTSKLSLIGDGDDTLGHSVFLITTPISIQGPTGVSNLTLAAPADHSNMMRLFRVTENGNLTLDHLTLTGGTFNYPFSGGAVLNAGTVAVVDSTIDGNQADNGGGLANSGLANISGSTFSNNAAVRGGGAIFSSGTLYVTNSTISSNVAADEGGAGIYCTGKTTITNATIVKNRGDGLSGSVAVALNNSIVAGNSNGALGTPQDVDLSLDKANSCNNLIGTGGSGGLVNGTNGNKVRVDVRTVLNLNLADNGGPTKTHALIAGDNPAVNAGNNDKVPAGVFTDQRGYVRTINETVDIGAVERDSSLFVPTSLVVDTLADENDGNYSIGNLSLREAIALAELYTDANNITFAPALFAGGPQSINLSIIGDADATFGNSAFRISTPISIQGPTGANGLNLAQMGDVNKLMRLFRVTETGNLTLDHLTLTGGVADGQGQAGDGGAIYNGGVLAVANSTINGNTASGGGGGIYNASSATPVQSFHPAGVGSVVINGADGAVPGGTDSYSIQRSKVNSIVITFVTTVTMDAGAIDVRMYVDGAPTTYEGLVMTTQTIINAGVPKTQATIRFTGSDIIGGSLPDGKYRLHVDYTKVHFTDGRPTPPADFTDNFFRLFGDRSGTGDVDYTDGAALQLSLGSHPGNTNFRWYFDYDTPNNGNPSNTINTLDNYQFQQRYGSTLTFNPSMVTVIDCTITGNSAENGGGIYNSAGSTFRATNCTISGNSGDTGGGILNNGIVALSNTIVAGNSATSGPDISGVATAYYSLIQNTSGWTPGDDSGNNITGADPRLASLDNYGGSTQTMALLPGSPAINAGTSAAPSTDQRGMNRVGAVDIGAFEVQNQAPTVKSFTKVGAEDNTLAFTATDFTNHFGDADGDALTAVRIDTLPTGGVLKLDGVAVTAGQTIPVADLSKLAFVPNLNFRGAVTFQFNASDGLLFAANPATITLNILSAQQQGADLNAQVDGLVAAGVLNQGQGNALQLNLKDNHGDAGKVQAFLNKVRAFLDADILTQAQADALLGPGNVLLLSVTRR
jgi:hypothetical protein